VSPDYSHIPPQVWGITGGWIIELTHYHTHMILTYNVEARILAVADAYIAMISDRPYRHAMSTAEAVKTLRGQAGKQWDPLVVTALLHVLK